MGGIAIDADLRGGGAGDTTVFAETRQEGWEQTDDERGAADVHLSCVVAS